MARAQFSKPSPTMASGRVRPRGGHDPGEDHPEQALADDQAGGHQHAQPLLQLHVATPALGPPVVGPAEQGADRDQQGQRHRQVHAHAHGQRRQPQLPGAGPSTSSITITTAPIERAEPDQAPVQVAAEHALGQRRDQRGLRVRPARSRPAPGAPAKPNAVLSRSSTGAITSDPKTTPMTRATCCFHGVAPTSWPVLRSCRLSLEMVATREHHRGGEQRVGDQRRGAVPGRRRARAARPAAGRCPARRGCPPRRSGCSTSR